uniref:Retrovirus-related Pol polyprotein from transposon TNT 1-94 n=1 Tax=Cajanus cajan TaxID=3821 RepID=A0A151UB25_CAJCA|nr:Retrovirus-related Pol polyprotein from transposon TNT 1-94 [Cajanus cajan]
MQEEMKSLEKIKTWCLTDLPAGKRALQKKWVFKVKEENDCNKRYKARLVVKMTTIRLVLSIVSIEDLHLEQLDVKIAFLHGDLDENIYMVQPEGFQIAGKENLVCKLTKSLYGLKQAPRHWYLKFDSFINRKGYKKCAMHQCCLPKEHSPKMDEDKAVMAKVPYAFAVGSLMYAMVCTRPNITHVMGVVSRFMSNPRRKHWEAVKWLLHYLKGTSKIALCFSNNDVILEGYSDALRHKESTTGFVFAVGGTTISWMSRLQKSVAFSTIEA